METGLATSASLGPKILMHDSGPGAANSSSGIHAGRDHKRFKLKRKSDAHEASTTTSSSSGSNPSNNMTIDSSRGSNRHGSKKDSNAGMISSQERYLQPSRELERSGVSLLGGGGGMRFSWLVPGDAT